MRLYLGLILGLLRRALHPRQDLLIENLVLRQQLAVCMRQSRRRRLRREDRLFWSIVARAWAPWRSHLQLVQPDTVVRWHRSAWRRSTRRAGGVVQVVLASGSRSRSSLFGSPVRTHAGAQSVSSANYERWDSMSALGQCVATARGRFGGHRRSRGESS